MATKIRRKLFKQRKFRQLLIALALISLFLGIIIVPLERNTNPDISTIFDGFYWAITTLTTVGYGDLVPITFWGKNVAIALQLLGAMMFGIMIAMIGSYVNRYQDEFYWNRLFERLDRLEDKMEKIQRRSEFMVKNDREKNK